MDLSTPKVMGILNVTPDSFYDGFRFTEESTILKHVEKMINEGADFIDVGGYSTRPGAEDISTDEELKRVIPAIEAIVNNFPGTFISIDTFRSEVARKAIETGASLINDISGGELNTEMFKTVADFNVPYVLMHLRGTPRTMTTLTDYENLIKEMIDYFHQRIFKLRQLGVTDLIIDPGFGFAKTIAQNFQLLNKLELFQVLGNSLLVGLSRKSLIWRTLKANPENALNGTSILNTVALLKGASILRVHDVSEAKEVITLLHHLN